MLTFKFRRVKSFFQHFIVGHPVDNEYNNGDNVEYNGNYHNDDGGQHEDRALLENANEEQQCNDEPENCRY